MKWCDRQKRKAQERLEALLLEGLNSGEGIEVTEEYWAERQKKLLAEVERRRKEK